jgi:hypothetical protein
MNTYHFRFNNGKNTTTTLFWFFAMLITITSTLCLLVFPSIILFLISIPSMLISIYQCIKWAGKQHSTETISLDKEGFTSVCSGSVLFSKIRSIRVPARQMGALGFKEYEYYLKQTDVDIVALVFSITMQNGETINWILDEPGGLYNSKEDFSVFFNFLISLTDHLYQLYHADEPHNTYLKILNEEGNWEKLG